MRIQRKTYKYLLLVLILLFILPGSVQAAPKMNKQKVNTYVGKSIQLRVIGRKKKVTWSSSDRSIASVSKTGHVKAKGTGRAIITATLHDGTKLSCNVYIKSPYLNQNILYLKVGKTFRLKLTGTPVKSWTTKKKAIATVSKNGRVKGVSAGTTTIICKDRKNRLYSCRVIVSGNDADLSTPETPTLVPEHAIHPLHPTRILFVGNSKTYMGNIPQQFAGLAKAAGKNITVDSVTHGGWGLNDIAFEPNLVSRITAKPYDYVIIQEKTANSIWDAEFLSGASKIVNLVKLQNPAVKVVIRQTWYRQGCSRELRKDIVDTATYVYHQLPADHMSVESGPMHYAEEVAGIPVFLGPNNVHQSNIGAYLAACCIYRSLWGSPVGNTFVGSAGRTYAETLQHIANLEKLGQSQEKENTSGGGTDSQTEVTDSQSSRTDSQSGGTEPQTNSIDSQDVNTESQADTTEI